MSRRLRTNIPTTREFRRPRVIDTTIVAEKDAVLKERQKANFDSRHNAREQESLNTGSNVWMRDRELEGTVVREAAPRSFEVETSEGVFKRNQSDLVSMPTGEQETPLSNETEQDTPHGVPETTDPPLRRSTRNVQPPVRLDPSWN